jgi:hypothetical protein
LLIVPLCNIFTHYYFVNQSATEESLIFSSLDAIVSMANTNTTDSTTEDEDTFEQAVEKLKSLIVEKENTKICLEGVRWVLFLFRFFPIFLVCCQLSTKKGSVQGFGSALIKCGSGYGSGSSLFSNCGSGFRIRIPDPDPGFGDLKLKKFYKKFNFYFFDQKLQFSYP